MVRLLALQDDYKCSAALQSEAQCEYSDLYLVAGAAANTQPTCFFTTQSVVAQQSAKLVILRKLYSH